MTTKLSLLAFDKNGYKVSVSVESENVLKAAAEYADAQKFAQQEGWQSDGMGAAAAKAFAQPNDNLAKVTGAGSCQFCGSEVEGIRLKDGTSYTAQQIATGRAEKMGKLGLTPSPVCGDCWKSRGLAQEYKNRFPYIPRSR